MGGSIRPEQVAALRRNQWQLSTGIRTLNAVPIDFHGNGAVIEAWRQYFLHLGKPSDTTPGWGPKRVELLSSLLHTMSEALHLTFEKSQIESEIYLPNAQVQLDIDQQIIRRGLVELFQGKALSMKLVDVPFNQQAAEAQTEWLRVLKNTERFLVQEKLDPLARAISEMLQK